MTEATLFETLPTIQELSDRPRIEIDKYKLQELWCKGIINDLSFVAFALELHRKPTLDMQQFSREWSVEDLSESEKDSGWKPKILKMRSVLNAMCILNDKNYSDTDITVKVNQLSLFD